MAVFFFYVGLELKREFGDGALSDMRHAALPLAGALGGMLGPAAIYVAMNASSPETQQGWGIPMATDIAFALGVLSLLGRRVPPSLKTFLLALAIIDDLGAILVIALFYGDGLHAAPLGLAGVCLAILLTLNRLGVVQLWPYLLTALPFWYFVHESGVHATVAGVLAALAIPYRTSATKLLTEPPLLFLEHKLREPVMFVIMPLFALANAGVSFAGVQVSTLAQPVTIGVALGLLLGKPFGIVLSTLFASRMLKTPLPFAVTALLGVGFLAGIGFTMSLFIGALAFENDAHVAQTRIGVFAASIAAAVVGLGALLLTLRNITASEDAERAAVRPFLVEDHDYNCCAQLRDSCLHAPSAIRSASIRA